MTTAMPNRVVSQPRLCRLHHFILILTVLAAISSPGGGTADAAGRPITTLTSPSIGQFRQQPAISGVTPAQIIVGREYTLTLTGSNLSSGLTISFGDGIKTTGPLTVSGPDRSQIGVRVEATAKPGKRQVAFVIAGRQALQKAEITVLAPPPALPGTPFALPGATLPKRGVSAGAAFQQPSSSVAPPAVPSAATVVKQGVASGTAAQMPLLTAPFSIGPIHVSPAGVVKDDLSVEVYVDVKNNDPDTAKKTPAPPLFFRCQPLDGGSCPGGQPNTAQVKQLSVPYELFGGEPDRYSAYKGDRFPAGKYRFSASRDSSFAKPATPDVDLTVAAAALTLFTIAPAQFDAIAKPLAVTIQGNGFHPGCTVLVQKTGNTGNTVWTPALLPLDPQVNPLHQLRAELPTGVTSATGNYQLWVKSQSGKESNRLPLIVRTPWQGPPHVNSYQPTLITWTDHLALDGGYTATVTLAGEGFTPDFWKNAPVDVLCGYDKLPVKQESSPDKQAPNQKGTLYLLLPTSNQAAGFMQNSGCVLRIFAPGGSVPLVQIPYNNQITLPAAPTIQKPLAGQSFSMQPVPVELTHPSLAAGVPLLFEWEYLPYGDTGWPVTSVPREVISSAPAGAGGTTSITVPTQKFADSGTYRFRVKVGTGNASANPWSAWRVFRFIRPGAVQIFK